MFRFWLVILLAVLMNTGCTRCSEQSRPQPKLEEPAPAEQPLPPDDDAGDRTEGQVK